MKHSSSSKLTLLLVAALLAGCGQEKQASPAPTVADKTPTAAAPTPETFENITTKLDSPAFGSVDGINDVTSPKAGSTIAIKGDKITIGGNFVDAVKGDTATAVVVVIDGKYFATTYGGERPDIAKAHNNPKYLKSQFYVEIPTVAVGPGSHQLKIRVIAKDRSGYYESDWATTLSI